MAKILRGRITGRYGMESHTAEELHAWADRFERRARFADPYDDPGWLRRWGKRIRCLAEQKEKARDNKGAVDEPRALVPAPRLESPPRPPDLPERPPVNEADFWLHLEYRICREFAGMANRSLRFLWCDGLVPARYHLNDSDPRITGTAWICNGPKQDEWEFALFLPHPVASHDEIDWSALLPPENVTRWLALDPPGKHVQIEPGAAVADLA
jgi:hypothetical protein